MSKVISLRGLRPWYGPAEHLTRCSPSYLQCAIIRSFSPGHSDPVELAHAMAGCGNAAFFRGLSDFETHAGVAALRQQPSHELLHAVYRDDFTYVQLLLKRHPELSLNKNYLWCPVGAANAACVSAAHLVRSNCMFRSLRMLNADLTLPDAEGRLPLYYWAAHVMESSLIAKGVQSLGMDPNLSGASPDFPLWRAIDHGNLAAFHGLMSCPDIKPDQTHRPNDIAALWHLLGLTRNVLNDSMNRSPQSEKSKLNSWLYMIEGLISHPAVSLAVDGRTIGAYTGGHPEIENAIELGMQRRRRMTWPRSLFRPERHYAP